MYMQIQRPYVWRVSVEDIVQIVVRQIGHVQRGHVVIVRKTVVRVGTFNRWLVARRLILTRG